MTSVDIAFVLRELESLVGARVEKVFQEGHQIHFALHLPGRGGRTLLAGDGMLFLSEATPPHAKVPTSFAMYLRKYLKGKRINKVVQQGFDRIVALEFDGAKMIFELFRDGNALFVSPEGQILSLLVRERWKDRTLKKGETYTLPPSGMNPVDITLEDFLPAMKNDKQVVAFLAREMSFGGTYAEEVCARAGIEKSTPCNTLPSKDVKLLLNTVKGLLNESITPSIIGEGEKRIDVVPISLKKYTDFSETKFSSFNSALEEYFLSGMNVKEEENAKKEKMTREKKILVRKKAQEDAIMRRDKEAGSLVRAAELISASYSEYESLILAVREKGIGKAKQVSVKVKSVDNKKKLISIDAGNGTTVELSIEKSLAENINAIYSRSKMLKQKMLRANDALLKTEKLLLEKREEIVMQKTCVREKQQKKEWYQKFRWFRSSNGFLVVGGRDATSNEVLIKKHTEKNDLVFHTDVAGSPFVVIKASENEIDKKTIDETAQFTASYSRAWKQGVGSLDVFYISPEQVTKKTPSGEYMGHGSFMVYGKKNWIKTELRIAVCLSEGAFLCGPVESITSKTGKYVLFGPGTTRAADIAKKIKAELFQISSKEEQDVLRKMSTEGIQKSVPFGSGEILKNTYKKGYVKRK